MSEGIGGLNREQWNEKLALIGQELARLGTAASVTVVGSAPGILAGQPARTSMDLDVWRPASDFDRTSFQAAVETAGLLYDPKGYEPAAPYIQMVEPGIVQVGKFEPEPVERYGGLSVAKAPAANLIASKLLRASEVDLYDIAWMMGTYQPDPADVGRAIKSFPREQRERATENMIYLQAIGPFSRGPEATSSPAGAGGVQDEAPSQLRVRRGRGR